MSQPLIKLFLLGAVLVFGYLAFRGSRKASYRLLWRAYGVLVVLAAGFSILMPDSLTELANIVGVRRGADLVLYVFVVTFMFVAVTLFRKVGELERRYVELVRTIAVNEAVARRDSGTATDDDG